MRSVAKNILLPLAALTLLTSSDAVGETLTWNGQNNSGTKGNVWNTGNTNWSGTRTSFVTGDNVVFADNSATRNVTISTGVAPNTVTIQSTYSFSGSGGGSIQASGAITIENGGALTLSTTSTTDPLLSSTFPTPSTNPGYGLTVNNGGSLILAGTGGNRVGDSTTISLNGGQIQISGSGSSETLGALTFSSSTSAPSLDFSGTGSSLTFSSITGSTTLNVFNFDPTDHLYLTSPLAPDVQIKFYSGSSTNPGPQLSYTAEVVPEPSTIIAGIGLVGFLGWRERRRIGALLKRDRDAGELAVA